MSDCHVEVIRYYYHEKEILHLFVQQDSWIEAVGQFQQADLIPGVGGGHIILSVNRAD